MHDRDQSHPTLAGSYFADCVFLAVAFTEIEVGIDLDIAGLDAKDRTLLQEFAWQQYRPMAKKAASP